VSPFTHPIAMPTPLVRSAAIAALMTATLLGSPATSARADNAAIATIQTAQSSAPQIPAGRGATEGKGETVDQRIATLHAALRITSGQEPLWNGVAEAMRENAVAIDKLVVENRATPAQDRTAVDDLTVYQRFAQAHFDGLRNLISSFDTLYNAMPDSQKKIADAVFANSGSRGARSHG
jgi:hypothetical protein